MQQQEHILTPLNKAQQLRQHSHNLLKITLCLSMLQQRTQQVQHMLQNRRIDHVILVLMFFFSLIDKG